MWTSLPRIRTALTVKLLRGCLHLESSLLWLRVVHAYLILDTVAVMRRDFEAEGGRIARIDGDYNPADLGFHVPK